MDNHVVYSNCPCCNSNNIYKVLEAEDFTVTHQSFEIWHCNNCTLRFTQNVPNATSISPYYQSTAYISHSDTKEGLFNKAYHFVRSITLVSKKNLIKKITQLQQGNLLDVGAGTGAFYQKMKTSNWSVTGLEPDATARSIAEKKFNINLLPSTELFNLPQNNFDAITMWHVLEHVHSLHEYLERFNSILKQKGKVFIAVPNYTSYDAEAYQQYWAAYDVPRHLYHFSPKSIEILAMQKGFTVKAFKPMWFDSFYVSMLSEKYKNGKGNVLSALFNGFISNVKTLFNAKKCSSVIYVLEKKNNV